MADDFDPYYTWLGIRPEEQPPDHYRLIGLKRFEDNADVIANATDRQMQFLRSMQVGKKSAQSQTLLNEISAAGGSLLDPQRKAKYDLELRAQEAATAQAAKAAAAKARPLPKATSLDSPRPAKASEAAPLPKNEVFSLQLTSGPAKPAANASSLTPAKPAPTHGLKTPAILAAAGGGVLLLVVVISVGGWMLFRGDGKSIAARPPSAKVPAANSPAKTPAANPSGTNVTPKAGEPNETGAKKPPAELKKEFIPAKPLANSAEPAAANTKTPTEADWKPPSANAMTTFRSFLGTYMYWLDRRKAYPIVNLQIPQWNLWTPEIQEKVRGKVPPDEISYVGVTRISVPDDDLYVLDIDQGGSRVLIDGVQTGGDFGEPKGEIRIRKGTHVLTLEIHSHGQPFLQDSGRISLKHKATGENVEFFNTWQDIQSFLATSIAGEGVTEISGWQPSRESELRVEKGYLEQIARYEYKHPVTGTSLVEAKSQPAVESVAGNKAAAASPPASVASTKAPVPDAAALDKALKQLTDVFADEMKAATLPGKKIELAKRMLQVEKESSENLALRYVLLDNVRKLYLAAGEMDQALMAVDSLAAEFAVEPWPLKIETATAISDVNVPPASRDQIAARLLTAIDEAAAAQQLGAAEDFIRLATKVSAKGRDIEIRKSISQKKIEFNRLKQHFAKVEEARVKLAEKGDDPEANLIVGKFVTLVLGNFEAGLPNLAKSGQELYSAAATAETKAIKEENGPPLAAADAWNKLGESLKGEGAATVALRRARDWYEIAAGEVQGLEKIRVQKRLKELQGLATTNLRKSYFHWPTTRDGFPLIDGVWDESVMPLLLIQQQGTFRAICEYDHPTDGRIRWEGDGTISKEGQMSLTLSHVQAPKSWTKGQSRTGQLSRDGGTLKGHATSTSGEHDFVWNLRGKSSVAQGETRTDKPVGKSKAVQGMVGRGSADGRDVNLFFIYHPGHKLTRDEIQELQNNLGKGTIRVEFEASLHMSVDADVAFHHVGGSSSGGVNYLYLDDMEINAVGDDRAKDQKLAARLGKGYHKLRWAITGGELGEAQLEVFLLKPDDPAKMEISAPGALVSKTRAPGVKQEYEYGTAPK